MTRDIRDRLNDVFWGDVEVDRIALTMDQIAEYDPPPNPAKITDSRAADYIRRYGSSSWELDALEPAVLNDLIIEAVDKYRDVEKYDAVVELERRQREIIKAVADNWAEIELEYGDAS